MKLLGILLLICATLIIEKFWYDLIDRSSKSIDYVMGLFYALLFVVFLVSCLNVGLGLLLVSYLYIAYFEVKARLKKDNKYKG